MAVRSIDELNITNFQDTGLTTPLDRYSFDLEIKWTNHDDTTGEHSSNRIFPNALAPMPLYVRRRFAEQMIEAVARVELGLSDWEDYR